MSERRRNAQTEMHPHITAETLPTRRVKATSMRLEYDVSPHPQVDVEAGGASEPRSIPRDDL
jgi:hypothetical protein